MKKEILVEFKIPDDLYNQCGEGYWNCVFAEWERQVDDFVANLKLSDPHYKKFLKKVIQSVVRKSDAKVSS